MNNQTAAITLTTSIITPTSQVQEEPEEPETLKKKLFKDLLDIEALRWSGKRNAKKETKDYINTLNYTNKQKEALITFTIKYEFGYRAKDNRYSSPNKFYEYFRTLQ